MHIKFLARGTGSGRDATGQPREGAEVLCGNPDKVAAVADSLDFEHRYTSGVIAWAPEKQPHRRADRGGPGCLRGDGLGGTGARDRYASWAAVLHREHGGGGVDLRGVRQSNSQMAGAAARGQVKDTGAAGCYSPDSGSSGSRRNASINSGSVSVPSTRPARYCPIIGPNLKPSADPPPANQTLLKSG